VIRLISRKIVSDGKIRWEGGSISKYLKKKHRFGKISAKIIATLHGRSTILSLPLSSPTPLCATSRIISSKIKFFYLKTTFFTFQRAPCVTVFMI